MGLGISRATVAGGEAARGRARDVLIEHRWIIAPALESQIVCQLLECFIALPVAVIGVFK